MTTQFNDPDSRRERKDYREPQVTAVLANMIATPSGIEISAFKGKTRTVLYRHSALTGWTYGFGVVH